MHIAITPLTHGFLDLAAVSSFSFVQEDGIRMTNGISSSLNLFRGSAREAWVLASVRCDITKMRSFSGRYFSFSFCGYRGDGKSSAAANHAIDIKALVFFSMIPIAPCF